MVSDRIKKFQLMPLNHQDVTKSTDATRKIDEKESKRALKTLMIAKGKFGNVASVLIYDISSYNYLFDGNLMTTSSKSKLIEEIEKRLSPSDYDFVDNHEYVTIVDFMSYIRSQKVDRTNFKTFGECMDKIFTRLVTSYENSRIFHLIFDSYIEKSWKSGTIQKRARGVLRKYII